MKRILYFCFIVAALTLGATACVKDEMSEDSVIVVSKTKQNDFDRWLEANFLLPYNIDFKYRFEMNESDMNYFTIPASYEYSIVMAHLVKYLCIETYDEVAGITFTRRYFPKMFFLTGEWEYRNNGTIILGTAEGGKKIFLAGVNLLPQYMKTAEDLNHYYIKTIHHEFTHILNQNIDYPIEFAMITGTGYVADSWSDYPYNQQFLENGFISDYAQYSDGEDFAETLSEFVTHDQAWWDEQVRKAGAKGSLINAKLDIVKSYMQDSFEIDLDVLRATVLRRQKDVFDGQVDLHSITIK
jgi:substrate import-associated zinc metallohydrolase lipoprotein